MSLSIDFKSRKSIIAIVIVVVLALATGISYLAEKNKDALNQHKFTPPPSPEEVARISEEVWQSYKREQAEKEKAGLPAEDAIKADTTIEVKDYFLESLREVLPVGADKEKIIELIGLDDPCLQLNEEASNKNLIVYECVISSRYPRGSVRRAILDNNGKLVDYFIDDNLGLHTGKPFEAPIPTAEETPDQTPADQ